MICRCPPQPLVRPESTMDAGATDRMAAYRRSELGAKDPSEVVAKYRP